MVGRLVQKHDVGLGGEHARQRRAPRLAARQIARPRVGAKSETLDQTCDAVGLVGGAKARHHVGFHRLGRAEIGLLREIADGRARLAEDLAAIGLDDPSGDFQEGRFARAVAPDQRNAIPRQDAEFDMGEKRGAAEGEAHAVEAEERGRSHGRLLEHFRPKRNCLGVGGPVKTSGGRVRCEGERTGRDQPLGPKLDRSFSPSGKCPRSHSRNTRILGEVRRAGG